MLVPVPPERLFRRRPSIEFEERGRRRLGSEVALDGSHGGRPCSLRAEIVCMTVPLSFFFFCFGPFGTMHAPRVQRALMRSKQPGQGRRSGIGRAYHVRDVDGGTPAPSS